MHSHTQTHVYTCTYKCTHNRHTHKQQTTFWIKHSFGPFVSTDFAFCAVLSPHSSGLLSGCGSEGSTGVVQSGNSLLIATEPAFRFAAGLHPNRHHRSHPANQRGTQTLTRAEALSRCGRMDVGHREGAKQGRQWW